MEKLMYSFLKEIKDNDNRIIKGETPIIPGFKDYEISPEAYGELILKLEDCGYIKASYARKKGIPSIVKSVEITDKGDKYLKENSKLGRVYRGLKELKEWIK